MHFYLIDCIFNFAGIALEPKFSYMEVDTGNLSSLLSHTTVNTQIPLLQAHPNLRGYIKQAIEKGINDLILPVVDRSVKYTINACEAIVKKDFAMDPEENRMRTGAQLMMRHLAAGMAMITSRDHIFITISTNLRIAFLAAIRGSANNQQVRKNYHIFCIWDKVNFNSASSSLQFLCSLPFHF